jgi:hypothetical protein
MFVIKGGGSYRAQAWPGWELSASNSYAPSHRIAILLSLRLVWEDER